MIEEVLTVLGIIILGVNHGLMQAYLNAAKASNLAGQVVNIAIPTVIDLCMVGGLIWGILMSSKKTTSKVLLIFVLIALVAGELYYIYTKPEHIILPQILLFTSSIFKLYVLVTLHCDVSSGKSRDAVTKVSDSISKFFEKKPQKPKPKAEPKAELKVEKEVSDIPKATELFNQILRYSPLSADETRELKEKFLVSRSDEQPWNGMWNPYNNLLTKIDESEISKEEKEDLRNKFRTAMGKPPKSV
jgi:hypothetical protein